MPIERRWLDIKSAAHYFNMKSPKTLYSLAARGRLPAGAVLRIGRQIRLDVRAIEVSAELKQGQR